MKKRLGDILIERGLLTQEDIDGVAAAYEGGRVRLGEALVESESVSKAELGAALEDLTGLPYVECPPESIRPDILGLIPASLAARACALPILAPAYRGASARASPKRSAARA